MSDVVETLQEAAEKGPESRVNTIAGLLVALTATFMALCNVKDGNVVQAMQQAQTKAVDQWSYYQAKSSRQNLSELAILLVPANKQEKFAADAERYSKEKAAIKTVADKLDAEAKQWDERSDHELHTHHRWAQSTTFLQVAIALSAIALLTRRTWLQWGVYGIALFGVFWGSAALF